MDRRTEERVSGNWDFSKVLNFGKVCGRDFGKVGTGTAIIPYFHNDKP